MATTDKRLLFLVAAPVVVLALAGSSRGDTRAAEEKDVTVSLCDGQSQMSVPGLKPGQALAPAEARKVAGDMMQIWRKTEGEVRWASWTAEATALVAPPAQAPPAAAPAALPEAGQPTKFTARDQMLWKREEKKWIDEGYKAFHNAKAVGGTIGVSCDMCHPNTTNTHPESYPKYQPQLKKVAHLRDMINWCIENPLKGKPLAENDPVLRSVEAYIISERKGVAIEAGKH